jgi:hypothetical protein
VSFEVINPIQYQIQRWNMWLMPTREEALGELAAVFHLISEEYRERGESLPTDTTEIVHA